jgi:hypothetical protein
MALSACGPDLKNPEAVTSAFMDAYKKKDPAGMLKLMSTGTLPSREVENRELLREAVKQGPSGVAHEEVFNAEMMAIMTGKGAKVEGPRYDAEGLPIFKVAEDAGDAYIVLLRQAGGNWAVDRLDMMGAAEFKALATKGPGA